MRLKLLLIVLIFSSGILSAQTDTIRTLIISQARMDRADNSYVEISNVGTTPIQMSDFEFGRVSPWDNPFPWTAEAAFAGAYIRLPEKVLQPGESYVVAAVLDFTEKMYPSDPDNYNERITKKEIWEIADMQIHMPEANGTPELDSVTPGYQVMETWNGRDCWYLEQHLSETDSVVVDQVGGVFDNDDGRNYDQAYDVAGMTEATGQAILVRKFNVKTGNTNFADARGIDVNDSEWIPIPHLFGQWEPNRAVFWNVGNHGDYKLDENTLVSDLADVDLVNKVITVAWGTRNQDEFMNIFEKKPGIAWHYDLSPERADSAYKSARTGDKITIYACGNTLESETFDIVVAPPTADANMVVPMYGFEPDGFYSEWINSGGGGMFGVTVGAPTMDSITNSIFGIPYATRVDTLVKYLEKAPKASWEIMWSDGMARTDVVNGDILKVTAENGSEKEYYIKVAAYRPSHNADLTAITWPDIPEYYKGIFGWIGDTIPNFAPTVYNYKVQVPFDVDGIPALVAKTQALNSTVKVTRATSLSGSTEQKTITFEVTAEDGVTVHTYKVQLEKEKSPLDVQPFNAEPFLSELVFQDQWNNGFIEICNPGNQPLDLSNYMMYFAYTTDPAAAIQNYSGVDDWGSRYRKYVPGYKWVDEATWAVTPGVLEQDINVNPIVYPGDVFVMAHVNGSTPYPWFASEQADIDFRNNPWGESYTQWASAAHEWLGGNFYIFKILNDSVKMGLKPANDPNDFEVIERWGMADGSDWVIDGNGASSQTVTFIRKPEYWKGEPLPEASFGATPEESQWMRRDRAYWNKRNVWWRDDIMFDAIDVGQHFFNEVTLYKSTVSSVVYKVSPGYGKDGALEKIWGMKPGLTSGDFMSNLIKGDENQYLKIKGAAGLLAMDAEISNNDTLVVMSADSINITKYLLEVSTDGLSSDAVLVSSRYTVSVDVQPKSASSVAEAGMGTITGIEYGTALSTLLSNITVPTGASMDVINGEGAYVATWMVNFDTAYVKVTVNDNIFLDVVAEDGLTEIIYQVVPDVSESDAFLLSDIYTVNQNELLINFVPRGTSVQTLLSNVVPSAGATVKVVDRLGHVRMDGQISVDDKVVVTSKDESNVKAYFISVLREQYFETGYLAYITSKTYTIDQVNYMVVEVGANTSVADFFSKIKAEAGSTAVLVDETGAAKTTGTIAKGDMVKVTSKDGKIVVNYTVDAITSSPFVNDANIEVYPNPTSGKINISGVEIGNVVQVYNSVGAMIRNFNVQRNIETVSLDNEPAGIYMVIVRDNTQVLGRYKTIKR